MISHEQARQLAEDWVTAWNRRDLDAVMAHYAEDIELKSPLTLQRLGQPAGRIHGKDNVRAYFARGLEIAPDLHFELIEALVGVDGVTILYRRENDALVADVAVLNAEHQVTEYRAYYGSVPAKE